LGFSKGGRKKPRKKTAQIFQMGESKEGGSTCKNNAIRKKWRKNANGVDAGSRTPGGEAGEGQGQKEPLIP